MAQPAPRHPQVIVPARVPDGFGAVAAGGPIADLHRTLEQRLLAADRPALPEEADAAGGAAGRLSRIAGPLLLVGAYAGLALWWF